MAGAFLRNYETSAALTITLTGLATDTNLLAGRESTAVDNSTNEYEDFAVGGFIMTGTTPTTAKQIEVHAIGSLTDTPTWPDVFDGTDSAETVSGAGTKAAVCRPIAILATIDTSDKAYHFGPVYIAQLFGDMPAQFAVFVTHNTAVNLNATAANHSITHEPISGRYT